MTAVENYEDWIGRGEEHQDLISAGPLDRLSATLDRDDPPFKDGDAVPPLGHWLYFLPRDRQSVLSSDGHPRRGGFLPPVEHLPRRMWAGSRLTFPGTLRVGMKAVRRSTIASVKTKQGASGELVFVTVRHEIGEPGGPALVTDEHDIVYRGLEGPAAKTPPMSLQGVWQRSLVPDEVLLFRYSALTFNAHRIHYDRAYVTKEEGYPGLVVHGPLTATLMIDQLRRELPEARIESFKFRAVSPAFDGAPLHLHGSPPSGDGTVELWTSNAEGGLVSTGSVVIGGATLAGDR